MFRNSVTSKLRSKAGSFLVASSIAVATIAVAGLTESPVSAAPVSFGSITVDRAIASDGTLNVYPGEEISMSAGVNVSSTCLGQVLQPGDVITLTDANHVFSDMTFAYGAHYGLSWTLPNPVPETFRIDGYTTKLQISTAGTKVFSPKVKVTRSGQLLVEDNGTCYVGRQGSARIDATSPDAYNDLKDVSQYVARVGDERLSYSARACVDMTLVAPGDVLTYSYELKTGGQNVDPMGGTPNYNWNVNMPGDYPGNTIPNPEPTRLELSMGGASGPNPTAGNTYTFSIDIKKGNDSVAINCPVNNPGNGGGSVPLPDGGGGPITMPRLYPTGQVSLTGELTLGSTVSVSLPSWSLTDGGPAVASGDITTYITWRLCNTGPDAQRTSMLTPLGQCSQTPMQVLMANGTSFGMPSGAGQTFVGSSLTITEPLATAFESKYLMVEVFVESAAPPGQMMGVFFGFNFKSCASATNCADSFGPASQPNPSVPPSTPDSSVPSSTPDSSTPDSSTPSSSTPSSSTPSSSTPSSSTPSSSTPSSSTPSQALTVPAPALATVQALPVAPTPIVADATISTGEEITVSFGGFTPFEFVQLIVASTPQVIGSGYADAQGVVTLRGNLPSNLASGNHTLAVFAPVSGVGFTQPITVSQPLLPATGSDGQNNLYVIAMLLFVLGLVVRRTSTVITNK
jgi:LPXTG-motif cell wall-anchored protein